MITKRYFQIMRGLPWVSCWLSLSYVDMIMMKRSQWRKAGITNAFNVNSCVNGVFLTRAKVRALERWRRRETGLQRLCFFWGSGVDLEKNYRNTVSVDEKLHPNVTFFWLALWKEKNVTFSPFSPTFARIFLKKRYSSVPSQIAVFFGSFLTNQNVY